MALYDTADLLARCYRNALRPSTDSQQSAADWYAFLTEAQQEWYAHFASVVPWVLYSNPTLMTTADSGLTYTFGTDADGNNIFPMGQVEIRAHSGGAVLTPTTEWGPQGDFVQEGDHIRFPNGQARTYGNGPIARFIAQPGVIDGSHEPTLKPVMARVLLVYRACAKWARRGGLRDPQPFLDQENEAWIGNPQAGVNGLLGMLRTQMQFSGLEGLNVDNSDTWFRGVGQNSSDYRMGG